jgi:hypothetical protein
LADVSERPKVGTRFFVHGNDPKGLPGYLEIKASAYSEPFKN